MTPEAHDAVSFNDISKTYHSRRGDILALENISFDVARGEFVSIVGPSGCGKSTLLKLTAGLLRPTTGTVGIGESGQIVDLPPAGHLGMVFQTPILLEWRTVLDNVLLPIEILGRDKREARQRAGDLLQRVGLKGFEHRYPIELSGGMQQRVAICRALVFDPPVLLMDEPFGALDALTRDEMGIELLQLWEATKKTILFVTHSIEEAVLLSDRVVVMSPRPGRIDKILKMDLPRPRPTDVRYTSAFTNYSQEIRQSIFSPSRQVSSEQPDADAEPPGQPAH